MFYSVVIGLYSLLLIPNISLLKLNYNRTYWYLMVNDASHSCDNVRVKRVQNEPSISFDPNKTHALQTDTNVSPTSPSNAQSNAQMIFYGSKPKQNSSWAMAQNTHSVCRTSWHVCSSADKHMVDITERLLPCRNHWKVGRGSRWFQVTLFLLFFFISL